MWEMAHDVGGTWLPAPADNAPTRPRGPHHQDDAGGLSGHEDDDEIGCGDDGRDDDEGHDTVQGRGSLYCSLTTNLPKEIMRYGP